MPIHPCRDRVQALLAAAGIRTGSSGDFDLRDWDMQVCDDRLNARLLAQGSLGLGESYVDGWWETRSLDRLLCQLLEARIDQHVQGMAAWFDRLRASAMNLQTRRRAFTVGERHYDLGNEFYRAMLGQRMVYSCGYWRGAGCLDQAQENKLDLVCRKLGLASGMQVLDIGCGWGEALKFAAQNYGVSGVGITISKEQAALAREICAGLPIEIRVEDYRGLRGQFDRAFSIGMFEHVGVRNYRRYFEIAGRCLRDAGRWGQGLFLLHTIGRNVSINRTDPWIARYIFPNSMLPSIAQVARASEDLFVIEDWHVFGSDYDRTLQAWRENVERAWPLLPARYDDRFRRTWRFYLAAAMASFRARRSQLWQVVMSPKGLPGGYAAPR